MSKSHLRRPAALWLAVTTLFGLAGTFIGLVPVVTIWSQYRAGAAGLGIALGTMVIYASLMVCPLIAWWMLLRRRYDLAIIIASPPILIWIASLLINRV